MQSQGKNHTLRTNRKVKNWSPPGTEPASGYTPGTSKMVFAVVKKFDCEEEAPRQTADKIIEKIRKYKNKELTYVVVPKPVAQ